MIFLRLLIISILVVGLNPAHDLFAAYNKKKTVKQSDQLKPGESQRGETVRAQGNRRKAAVKASRQKKQSSQEMIKVKEKLQKILKAQKIYPKVEVIDLIDGINLTKKGDPTIQALKNLIHKYWPSLGKISINLTKGGANTRVVYAIINEQGKIVFFCKISTVDSDKKYQAWENLAEIQKSRVGQFTYGLSTYKDRPIITLVEKFFRYKKPNGDACVIEITHLAQGSCVNNFLDGSQNASLKELTIIGKTVGKALGSLHHRFMININQSPDNWRTIIHGDFHPENVFIKYLQEHRGALQYYDQQVYEDPSTVVPEFYRVYFIDNETIRLSIDKLQEIDWDLLAFICLPMLYWKYLNPQEISENQWNNILTLFSSFLDGYVSVFPEERQPELIGYIKNMFSEWFTMALECVDKIVKNQPIKLKAKNFKRFTDSDSKYGTWEGFIDFVEDNKQQVRSITKRLQEARDRLAQ